MILTRSPRDTLLTPLQAVSGIIERRHTLPILSNVLIEKFDETLTLLATDIEIQITISTPIGGEGNGGITVSARKLLDILRSLPENAEVSLLLEDKRMLIKSGKSRFNLQTLPAADFPRLAIAEGNVRTLALPQNQLRRLFGQTLYAMAQQDVRYYLNGLLLIIEESELRAVATDGHRLAYSSITLLGNDNLPYQDLIIPRKTVIELNRLLADSEETLSIDILPTQVRFSFGQITLVSKLIDGRFPDYQRVIPSTLRTVIEVNRLQLLQSLARAAILTTEKFRGIRLVLAEGGLKINVANTEQEEALEEIEVDYNGEPIDVGFNVSYLQDMLNNCNEETIAWGFNDANSSALLTLPGNDRFKYVVMPMRI